MSRSKFQGDRGKKGGVVPWNRAPKIELLASFISVPLASTFPQMRNKGLAMIGFAFSEMFNAHFWTSS